MKEIPVAFMDGSGRKAILILDGGSNMARKFPVFEVFHSNRAKEYRWRLRSTNGEIVAASGDGFKQRAGVVNAIRAVKLAAARGVVEAVKVVPKRLLRKPKAAKPKANKAS